MRALLVLMAVLLAGPSLAVDDWGYSGCGNGNSAGSNQKICFDLDTSFSTAYTTFMVNADAALICLKTDVDQEGVSATGGSPVKAIVRYCPFGPDTTSKATAIASCGIQVCATAGCELTGLNGIPTAQLACVIGGPGAYMVDFTALPDSPDVGLFSVEGAR